jgi:hypothetical protein
MLNPDEAPRAEEQEDRLPWHKPRVQQIKVAINTGDTLKDGSEEDQDTYAASPGHYVDI